MCPFGSSFCMYNGCMCEHVCPCVCVYVTRCNFVYDCSACEYTHVKMFAYEYTVSCICKHVDVYYIDMCETTSE